MVVPPVRHAFPCNTYGGHTFAEASPKELLERGPPAAILRALERFIQLERDSVAEATQLCSDLGFVLPEGVPQTAAPARRRLLRKEPPSVSESRKPPFVHSSAFDGERPGYHFKQRQDGLGYYLDATL